MAELREIPNVRQIQGEHPRRWFESDAMDLIVWYDERGAPVGFQLCYDKGIRERALTLTPAGEVSHAAVDDGESQRSTYKGTPVLSESSYLDAARVERLFAEASAGLPSPVVELVTATLQRQG